MPVCAVCSYVSDLQFFYGAHGHTYTFSILQWFCTCPNPLHYWKTSWLPRYPVKQIEPSTNKTKACNETGQTNKPSNPPIAATFWCVLAVQGGRGIHGILGGSWKHSHRHGCKCSPRGPGEEADASSLQANNIFNTSTDLGMPTTVALLKMAWACVQIILQHVLRSLCLFRYLGIRYLGT